VSTSHPTIRLIGWALLVCAAAGHADQVYKYVDAQGHVTYSDRPNTAGAKKTEVTFQQADPHEAARLAKEGQLLKAADDQRKKQQANDDKAKAQQDKDKAARCQTARTNYNAIKENGRLYNRDAEGNKVYYNDAEADAKREAARQVMTTACGT
jgi:Skp family chaperone for outer membrane proteins